MDIECTEAKEGSSSTNPEEGPAHPKRNKNSTDEDGNSRPTVTIKKEPLKIKEELLEDDLIWT